ncbi:ATP-binding cassette domain-containing protein [candidate division KSB1 bacterium]|nr:ATP-binding cassette domain-containing protein [candidate division KSB1 bacterium]
MKVLELNQVCKSYENVHAVKNLTLSIEKGSVFGLLGPNGAGKTSAIRMIMGIIHPDSGSILRFGQSSIRDQTDRIGYLPEERGLYPKMKVMDTILFFAEIKNQNRQQSEKSADSWLKRLELEEWKDKKVESLSRGMQQKLQFICTIIHNPELIILDEPFTGLDPVNTSLIKDVILDLQRGGTTIIFSTHLMEQVEKLCKEICLIDKGEAVLKGKLSEIKRQSGKNRIKLSYDGEARFLNDPKLVKNYDNFGQYVEIDPAQGIRPQQILAKAIEQVEITLFEIADPSLNEIFITSVKKTRSVQ